MSGTTRPQGQPLHIQPYSPEPHSPEPASACGVPRRGCGRRGSLERAFRGCGGLERVFRDAPKGSGLLRPQSLRIAINFPKSRFRQESQSHCDSRFPQELQRIRSEISIGSSDSRNSSISSILMISSFRECERGAPGKVRPTQGDQTESVLGTNRTVLRLCVRDTRSRSASAKSSPISQRLPCPGVSAAIERMMRRSDF